MSLLLTSNFAYNSPSQQERLLQIYRLPSAGSDVLVFQLTILTLIKLVQAALALFGLGPLAQDETGQLVPDGLRERVPLALKVLFWIRS